MWIAIKSVHLTLRKPPSQKSRANFNTNTIKVVQTLPVFNITLTKRRCKYDNGTCYRAVNDWKGSTRSVVSFSQEGNISTSGNAFIYPSGLMASAIPGAHIDRKHQDKRWIAENGLNLYDNNERLYDPITGRFTVPDRCASKYPQFSPYTMAAANPATYFDQQGDTVAVLYCFEHVGMLIQNRSGQYEYFSVNGIPISEVTGGFSGRSYNCKGERSWPSVDAFISDTNYNRTSEDPDDTSVSGMVYTDYVVLPTTAQQDDLIKESMTKSCNMEYNFVLQNCTTAVSRALEAGNALPVHMRRQKISGFVSALAVGPNVDTYLADKWSSKNEPGVFFYLLKSEYNKR